MFDSEVLELCRDCLLDAIRACSGEDDLSLGATALSSDLRLAWLQRRTTLGLPAPVPAGV
jgi:hypothetical protein